MNTLKNKVNLIGRLGAKPVAQTFDSGAKKVRLSVATNERFKNKKGEDDAVNGFQREYQVHGKGRHFFKRADVEVKGKNGTHPTEYHQPDPIPGGGY